MRLRQRFGLPLNDFKASFQGDRLTVRRAKISAPPLLLAFCHFFARSKAAVCNYALKRSEPAAIIGRLGAFTFFGVDLAQSGRENLHPLAPAKSTFAV